QLQAEEIQQLKDEIARLKGQKPKPKIKPSNLEKQTEERETKKTKKRRKKKKKTKHLEIAETIHLKPDNLPPRSRLKDYQE
ncbi:MAG: transposase, partial [Thermodesulfobacteriota bacterium]|nr:transposase [Thermodesulfobacteriota bacterium]